MTTAEALSRLPRLLLQGRLATTFDGVPLVARALPFRKRRNLVRSGLDALLGRCRLTSLPPTIQIEPTNCCNLKCPLCPTGTDSMHRPKGFMPMDTFRRILDELGDVLVSAVLYGWGEPFLHRDLPAMIAACTERGILTVTSTNGHCLQTLDEALRVVDAGLSGLIIALDGSTQEVYAAYRKAGQVDRVKRCAEMLEEAKARRGAALPYTDLRVVLTRRNRLDLQNVEALARQLGVDMFSYKRVSRLTAKVHDDDRVVPISRLWAPRSGPHEPTSGPAAPPVRCHFAFRQPTVFWDGTVVGCEFDYDLETPWGRIGERPFAQIWNSDRAVALRRCLRKGLPRPAFCETCPYRGCGERGTVLALTQVRASNGPTSSR